MKFPLIKIFLILVLISLNTSANAEDFFSNDCKKHNKQYKVIKVFDGDTIQVVSSKSQVVRTPTGASVQGNLYKIRFLGIDAFEHEQFPYGPLGQKFLSMLVLEKNVCIETDVTERDKYGRTLAYVFLSDKNNQKFVNEEIVKSGYAILFPSELNVRYKNRLKKALIYGRSNMLGVWSKHDYILESPSEWRHKHPHTHKKSKKRKKH